ncbi:related to ATP-dependent RNA helicase [Pseudozyma flocculosa]|uniref:Related to ATP-dependent RNA helicase n=1 Tax=Pseudozyma flocculosa TaxID=84751 RepID=A0A5C3FB70_9BASI|nr:related to ATP-dependent RNA helicase [Pseudozyma flocculosa]
MSDQAPSWRTGAAATGSASGGSSSWGRGSGGGGASGGGASAPSSSSKRGGRGGPSNGKRSGGRKAASSSTAAAASSVAASKFLPTQPLPYQTAAHIREYYIGLVESGRIKQQWLENPKSPIQNYVLLSTGQAPVYSNEEGRVEGRRDKNIRSTLVLDADRGWAVYGDAKTAKDAEKAAALHAVLFLQEQGDLLNKAPKPSAAVAAALAASGAASAQETVKLSDGSNLTADRAREFMDFYCRKFKFGKPDISVHPATQQKGRKSVSTGWRATMTVGGSEIGEASGRNKKAATTNCYLDTVQYLESTDPELWKHFDATHVPGAPIGMAPHIYFTMSDELDDDVRGIYEEVRRSKIFAKRPRTAGRLAAGEGADDEEQQRQQELQQQQARKRARRYDNQRRATDDVIRAKSEQLMQRLEVYHSDDRLAALRDQRASLPVTQKQSDVLVKIELNQVTICMAATGSGKTTQIPQILFDDYILQGRGGECNIICTQPRRIAAISVAERVARERGEKLGESVGYQVRFEAKLPQPNGSVTFCTTGVFLRRLQSALGDAESSNGFLDSITHVVIDEVHERDVETDLLLVVIKRLLEERRRMGKREIKVILMSATIDPTLFQRYFTDSLGRPAPVVEVPGRSFPVEKHYLEETVHQLQAMQLGPSDGGWVWREKNVRDYLEREINQRGGMMAARGGQSLEGGGEMVLSDQVDDLELPYPLVALMIAYVLSTSEEGHVLVFLPGWEEIKSVNQILSDPRQRPLMGLNFNDGNQFEIHILHSTIPVQDQQAVFEPVRHAGIRRIILATNIAETSITIPDVVYVVDTGRVKEKRFDPERHLSSLVSAWVGTSNLNQRAGRAGRHRPGEYYGVLSKARYDRLSVNQTVEMKRVDLSNVVMHIKALDIPGMEVEDVLAAAIEPPAPERVRAAMEKLKMVGALDQDKRLTSLGRVLLQLPVDAPMGKMCLYGAFFRCLDPVLSLAAILTNRDPFMAPVHLKKEADAIKDQWCPPDFRSDALGILRAYTRWWDMQGRGEYVAANRFCSDNFLSKTTLLGIQQVKEHLFQSMEKADIIQVIQSQQQQQRGGGGGTYTAPGRYRARPRETDPEFNTNSDSAPLLAALIAVATAPNFAIRANEKTYRTSQDKTCFIHPASVCHLKYTKHKHDDASHTGERELIAFSEKVRNTSMQTSGGASNAMTMLRGCTRLDPLTYMLFGAYDVRVTSSGIECDDWLPITGNLDALDDLERLKAIMDVVMLRQQQRRGGNNSNSNNNNNNNNKQLGARSDWDDVDQAQDEGGEDDDDDEWGDRTDLSLSAQEIGEFERMTMGIVHVLDGYSHERLASHSIGSSRASTRPGTPSTLASGGGGGGGAYYEGGSGVPSNGGSRWNSRPQTPSSYGGGGGGGSAAAGAPPFATGANSAGPAQGWRR